MIAPEGFYKDKEKQIEKMKENEKIYEPVSIEDAINCLQEFLESDLWSKFKDEKIKGKWYSREDKFKSEKELWHYLEGHFDILRKEVKKLQKKSSQDVFTEINIGKYGEIKENTT